MKKITLSDAKSMYEFCVAMEINGLVPVASLNNEDVEKNRFMVCLSTGNRDTYNLAPIVIVPDAKEESKCVMCSNLYDRIINSDLGRINYSGVVTHERAGESMLSGHYTPISNGRTFRAMNGSKSIESLMENSDYIKKYFNILQNVCFNRAVETGWHDKEVHDGVRVALMHSELSEALEGLRKDCQDDKLPHRKMVEVELADTIIRILDFAGLKGFDVIGAIIEKILYNVDREDHKKENRQKEGGKKF